MAKIRPLPTDRAMAKLSSPCISLCKMDLSDGFCIGCYRTRGEIAAWPSMGESEQLNLLNILSERRAAVMGGKRRRPRRQVQRSIL